MIRSFVTAPLATALILLLTSPAAAAPGPDSTEDFDLFRDGSGAVATSGIDSGICGDRPIPGISRAVAAQYAIDSGSEGGEYSDERGLLVFTDADAAVGFMSGLRAQARSCPTSTAADGTPESAVAAALPGPWGEGLVVMSVSRANPADQVPSPDIARYFGAVRTGRAVLVTLQRGESFVTEPYVISQDRLDFMTESLGPVARALCQWTVAGCAPAAAAGPTPGSQVPVRPRGGVRTGTGAVADGPDTVLAGFVAAGLVAAGAAALLGTRMLRGGAGRVA